MSQSTPTQHEIDTYAGEFVLTGDKSKSWRKAFPKSKAKSAAVNVSANRLHNRTKVLLRIDELRVETAEKDAVEFDLSATQLKEYLKRVMDAGLEEDDSGKRVGLSATNQAVAEWNRMSGNHAPVERKLSGSIATLTHEQWLDQLDG